MTKTDTFPMTLSPSLGVEMPDGGYSLKGFKKTIGREGEGFVADIVRNGKVVGEMADYGDGGGGWIRYMPGDERDRFKAFIAQMPPLLTAAVERDYPDLVTRTEPATVDEEEAVCILAAEYEILRTLKRRSKKNTPFLVDDENAFDGFRELTAPFSPAVVDYLKSHFPGQRVRVWLPASGWTEI